MRQNPQSLLSLGFLNLQCLQQSHIFYKQMRQPYEWLVAHQSSEAFLKSFKSSSEIIVNSTTSATLLQFWSWRSRKGTCINTELLVRMSKLLVWSLCDSPSIMFWGLFVALKQVKQPCYDSMSDIQDSDHACLKLQVNKTSFSHTHGHPLNKYGRPRLRRQEATEALAVSLILFFCVFLTTFTIFTHS